MGKRRKLDLQQEAQTETGWTDWIRPKRRGYLMACCDCGLIHELQFDTVERTPFRDGEVQEFKPVRGDAIFRARRRSGLTARHRKEREP